jgi:hypothetical protein
MNIVLSYPQRYNFDLVVPQPYTRRIMPTLNVNIDCYRIARQSIDTFLSRAYTHCLTRNVKPDHLSSPYTWRYADVEITTRKRYYALALAVCAPSGYLTRRLHYLYRSAAIERTESGVWVAYVPDRDLVTSDSLFALIQSLCS